MTNCYAIKFSDWIAVFYGIVKNNPTLTFPEFFEIAKEATSLLMSPYCLNSKHLIFEIKLDQDKLVMVGEKEIFEIINALKGFGPSSEDSIQCQ